jgi:hypothetical protein
VDREYAFAEVQNRDGFIAQGPGTLLSNARCSLRLGSSSIFWRSAASISVLRPGDP